MGSNPTFSARQSMNKLLTELYYFLHTIKHINKVGLVWNKLLAIIDDGGLRIVRGRAFKFQPS